MTKRAWGIVPVLMAVMVTVGLAQGRGGQGTGAKPPAKPPTKPPAAAAAVSAVRAAACVSPLGKGISKGVDFCDVIVGATGDDSVSMQIPPHTGPATLFFDLHPRFEVTGPDGDPARLFQKHLSVVAIVGPTGEVIDRGEAASGEFRSTKDLYDRMASTIPGQFKVVAPGMPTSIKVPLPANITSIGIVGVRVEIMTRFNQQAYPDPGRPVAIVSNWRIEYVPK